MSMVRIKQHARWIKEAIDELVKQAEEAAEQCEEDEIKDIDTMLDDLFTGGGGLGVYSPLYVLSQKIWDKENMGRKEQGK